MDQLLDVLPESLTSSLDKPWYDASKINEFRTCPQKYFNHYVKGLVTEETSHHLDFGVAWHAALECFYTGTFFNEVEYDCEFSKSGKLLQGFVAFLEKFPKAKEQGYKTRLAGLEFLAAYVQKHREEPFDVLAVERSFLLDMGSFYYLGRIDLVIKWDGRVMPKDHKTASRFGPAFESMFKIDTQISGYIRAVQRLIEPRCNSAVISATRITKNVDPNESFLRKITTRNEWELEMWESDLRQTVADINHYMKVYEPGRWPRDGQRCYDYNSPCPYYNLCLTHPTSRKPLEDANYKIEFWEPL